MMTYSISSGGAMLHYYGAIDGRAWYGWGTSGGVRMSDTTPRLVEFFMREEAQNWIEGHRVFCGSAVVVEVINSPGTAIHSSD